MTQQIIVRPYVRNVILRPISRQIIVSAGTRGATGEPGPQGPAGEPGADGDKHYTHTQGVVAATWPIPHNLGKHPAITTADSAGNEFLARIEHVDDNNAVVHIDPSKACSGTAYCN